MKSLYFIRHGESVMGSKKIVAGTIDSPLSLRGKEQALEAAKDLVKEKFKINLIISSPQKRAFETAKIIAKEIGYQKIDIVLSDGLRERDFGTREGQDYYKPGTKEWAVTFDELNAMDGVEALDQLDARADKLLSWVKSLPHENILLVSHGGIGMAIKRKIDNKPWSEDYSSDVHPIPNAKVIKFI